MRTKDNLQLWTAINWQGEVGGENNSNVCPSDNDFKDYFETNFNPPDNVKFTECDFSTDVSIPLLDDPISLLEIQQQEKQLKPDKASGPDVVSPGIVKLLPVQWIMYMCVLFNNILYSGSYPLA